MINLVGDIIKLSKLDEGSVELEKENVDLYQMTREIVSRLALQAEKRRIQVEVVGEHVECFGIRLYRWNFAILHGSYMNTTSQRTNYPTSGSENSYLSVGYGGPIYRIRKPQIGKIPIYAPGLVGTKAASARYV